MQTPSRSYSYSSSHSSYASPMGRAPARTPIRTTTSALRSTTTNASLLPTSSSSSIVASSRAPTAGLIAASEPALAGVLAALKKVQVKVDELDRTVHQQSFERDAAGRQLTQEREARLEVTRLCNDERAERQALERQLRALEASFEAERRENARWAAGAADVGPRLQQVEARLAHCVEPAAMEAALAALEGRLQSRVATVSASLDEYYRDFTAASAALGAQLKEKQSTLAAMGEAQAAARADHAALERALSGAKAEQLAALELQAEAAGVAQLEAARRFDALNGRCDALGRELVAEAQKASAASARQAEALGAARADLAASASLGVEALRNELGSGHARVERLFHEGLNELKGEVYTVQQHAAKSLAEAMAGIGEALTQQSAATVAVDTALRAALDDEAAAARQALSQLGDESRERLSALAEGEAVLEQALRDGLAAVETRVVKVSEAQAGPLGELEVSLAALRATTSSEFFGLRSAAQAQAAELRGLVAQQSEDVLAIAEAMRHEVAAAQGNMANQVAALGEELKCFAPKIALDDLSLKIAMQQGDMASAQHELAGALQKLVDEGEGLEHLEAAVGELAVEVMLLQTSHI